MNVMDSKVLKLNKSYMPIGVITAKTAFEMLYTERAEVVSVEDGAYMSYDFESWAEISALKKELEEFGDVDDVIFTSFLTLQVPRVIRTLHYNKPAHHGVKLSRKNIYLRDGHRCQYCGKKFVTSELTIDHVLPRSQGGVNAWDNLVCACFKCNQKKAGRTPRQANMRLLTVPRRPKHNPSDDFKIIDERYSSWSHFVSNVYWNVELEE